VSTTAPKLRNIGPKSAAWLRQVGLRSLQDDLAAIGAVDAFMKVRRAGFKPSLNLLYSLEGALQDCHWQEVPEARRTELVLAAEAAIALLPPPRGRPAALAVSECRDVPQEGGEGESVAMESSFGFDDPMGESDGGGGGHESGGGDER
jgi:DNA transformation protein